MPAYVEGTGSENRTNSLFGKRRLIGLKWTCGAGRFVARKRFCGT